MKNFFGASKNYFRASRCWLQLARRASCKINFLCTLAGAILLSPYFWRTNYETRYLMKDSQGNCQQRTHKKVDEAKRTQKWQFQIQFYSSLLREQDNLVLSTELIMWIGHRKEIRKLTFRALALRRSESERNVSFRISLRWLIHIINSVDKTKLSCNTPHRRSTTVSSF